MIIDNPNFKLWTTQLRRVPAPSPECARRLVDKYSNYGNVHELASVVLGQAREARCQRDIRIGAAVGTGLAGVVLAAALRPAAGLGLAIAGGAVPGALALCFARMALASAHQLQVANQFYGELDKWAQAAQEQLPKPASESRHRMDDFGIGYFSNELPPYWVDHG